MTFGDRIKQLRIENKWTQEYVCEKLSISSGALSRYETGMYEPKSLELVKDFAILYGVSTDYLLGMSDKRCVEEVQRLDANGLDEDELLELQRQIDFIKKMKRKTEK